MCEQVAYAFPVKKPLDTFQELLKKGNAFHWDDTLTKLFTNCREYIANAVCKGVKTFDGEKITTVETDWSTDGMGFWCRQKVCQCPELKLTCCSDGWRVSMAGSRFCSGAESRYTPIEGELAAIVYALEKTHVFTMGAKNLILVTDHKPLVGLLKGPQTDNNARLSRLCAKIVNYDFIDIWHVPGEKNAGPDALSRHANGVPAREQNGERSQVLQVTQRDTTARITYNDVRAETDKDGSMRMLRKLVDTDFTETNGGLAKTVAGEFWRTRPN